MQQKFNFHSHTSRCGHAGGSDEAYVQEAIKNGYEVMGFSDHAPYINGYDPHERMKVEELDEYIQSIEYLQQKYQGQIEIFKGLEVEWIPERAEELKAYRQQFDYLILGEHTYTLDVENYFYDHVSDEDVLLYASMVEDACDAQIVDIIAHPDLFMYGKEVFSKACEEASHRIVQAAMRNHILLEVNLNGLKYGKVQKGEECRYLYPYRKFWEIVAQYDVGVVYGLDAHAPSKYGDFKAFEIVQKEIIYDLNLNFVSDLSFQHK